MTEALHAALRALPAQDLVALVARRAEFDEDFRGWLETEMAAAAALRTGKALDPGLYRRRVETLFAGVGQNHGRSRRSRYDEQDDIDEGALSDLINEAAPFLAAGDAGNALTILVPVANALVEVWPGYASWDETLHDYFPVLDQMFAQALLLDSLSGDARDDLISRVEDWQGELEDFLEESFGLSTLAAERGWNEPGLDAILAGNNAVDIPEEATDWYEQEFVAVRLAALEAMGRSEAYLNLARAYGRTDDTCVMLARCGRGAEAIALAHAELRDLHAIQRLADVLWHGGTRDAALDLADWALSLPDDTRYDFNSKRHGLACWLRTQAGQADRHDLTRMAARIAFESQFEREDYQVARQLHDAASWPAVRTELLQALIDARRYVHDRIDILLDEGMIEQAIAAVGRDRNSPHDETLKRLADEACQTHPDWVIAFATGMAAPIMDEGRSEIYDLAAQWLERAGRAHDQRDTWDEWIETLDALIVTHKRKYKLRAALEALRG